MAPTFSLLSLLLLTSFSLYSEARPGIHFHPCNTLIFSSYTFSLRSQNPNNLLHHRPAVFTAEFIEFRSDSDASISRPLHGFRHPENLDLPSTLGFTSLKDRVTDILNVVAALLLGVGCGGLTAGTMFLIWSLFNNNRYRSVDELESEEDEDDDVFNPKKKGYVTIPAGDSAPVKESA